MFPFDYLLNDPLVLEDDAENSDNFFFLLAIFAAIEVQCGNDFH
jgi:hypothetical protein